MFCPSCGNELSDHAAFCSGCGKPTIKSSRGPSKTFLFITFGVFVLIVGVWFLNRMAAVKSGHSGSADPSNASLSNALGIQPPPPVYVPHTEKLLSGQITVPAGNIYNTRFEIDTTTMKGVRVVGKFSASGGSGNDIQAVITDEMDFENWKNGHAANALYSTDKTTVGMIDVPINASGTYYLAFSNKWSVFAAKYVYGDVELRYNVRQ